VAYQAIPGPDAYDPRDYGAIPNDGLDDRDAIQAAADAACGGGLVQLGAGVWNVVRAGLGKYNPHAGVSVHCAGVTIRGVGAATVLAMVGDQGDAGYLGVIAVDPGASDITIRDLVIDTSAATNVFEQTHAIQIGSAIGTGPVTDVRLEGVRYVHPEVEGAGSSGDCLRLLGSYDGLDTGAVRRVTVIGSTFLRCARSGISVQRNVHDLVISGNQFNAAGGQDIDYEPGGLRGPSSAVITGNVFHDDGGDPLYGRGEWAMALTGILDAPDGARFVVSDNVFHGRGLILLNVADTVIRGNVFDAEMESLFGVVTARGFASRLIIEGNVIRRRGAAGPVVLVQHITAAADHVLVSDNVTTNETAGDGIVLESTRHATVSGNDLSWTVPATTRTGIRVRPVTRTVDDLLITGNRIAGSLGQALHLSGDLHPFGAVMISGNQSDAPKGLVCAGTFGSPVVYAGNQWTGLGAVPVATCPASVVTLVEQWP
jgi:hypothetical protein